ALDRAIGAEEDELEAPRPLAARCQRRLEPRREPLDAREHILLARDRLVKALLRDIERDRQTRGERFGFAAKRVVALAHETGPEAHADAAARGRSGTAAPPTAKQPALGVSSRSAGAAYRQPRRIVQSSAGALAPTV